MTNSLTTQNNLYLLLFIVTTTCILYIIKLIHSYKVQIREKDMRLILFYLDKKFVAKLLAMLNDASYSTHEKRDVMLTSIKDYFELEDIIFYVIDKEVKFDPHPGVYMQNLVTSFIAGSVESILASLQDTDLVTKSMHYNGSEYILHISYTNNIEKDRLVAFVRRKNASFEKRDLETLGSSVKQIITNVVKAS